MRNFARLRSWLRACFHRSRMERQMDDELHFHIERYAEDLVASGLSVEQARRRARAEFGIIATHKEDCRDALGLRLLDDLRADCLYTVRMLRQSPAFTLVAVLSLWKEDVGVFARFHPFKIRWIHADNGYRNLIYTDLFADNRCVAAETARPKAVTDNRYGTRRVSHILGRSNRPAGNWYDTGAAIEVPDTS